MLPTNNNPIKDIQISSNCSTTMDIINPLPKEVRIAIFTLNIESTYAEPLNMNMDQKFRGKLIESKNALLSICLVCKNWKKEILQEYWSILTKFLSPYFIEAKKMGVQTQLVEILDQDCLIDGKEFLPFKRLCEEVLQKPLMILPYEYKYLDPDEALKSIWGSISFFADKIAHLSTTFCRDGTSKEEREALYKEHLRISEEMRRIRNLDAREIRLWLDNPDNQTLIQSITALSLAHTTHNLLPPEICYFHNLKKITIERNSLLTQQLMHSKGHLLIEIERNKNKPIVTLYSLASSDITHKIQAKLTFCQQTHKQAHKIQLVAVAVFSCFVQAYFGGSESMATIGFFVSAACYTFYQWRKL
jgi:hypothetical protein